MAARRADLSSVTTRDFAPRLGTGFRAVPANENTSRQQAAILAVFK
jgi:hypothetical protein